MFLIVPYHKSILKIIVEIIARKLINCLVISPLTILYKDNRFVLAIGDFYHEKEDFFVTNRTLQIYDTKSIYNLMVVSHNM